MLAGIILLSGCRPVTADVAPGNNQQPLDPVGTFNPPTTPPPEPVGTFNPPTTPPPEVPEPPPPMTYEKYFSEERPLAENSAVKPYRVKGINFNTFPFDQYWMMPDREVVYTLDFKNIYLTSQEGTKSTLLYSSSASNILYLISDGTLLFFLEGEMVRRMYLPDGTVDDMCIVVNKYNADGRFFPETNHTISWREFAPEMEQPAADKMGISLEEFMALANKGFGVRREFDYLTGKTVSIGESYIINKYYTDGGK